MRPGPHTLLRPRVLSVFKGLNPVGKHGVPSRILLFTLVGLAFWLGAFAIFYRVLTYFQSVEDFGNILAIKLLSMMMITFFTLLIFSSIINTLTHFYLSRDLGLLHSLPVSSRTIFLSRLTGSAFDSSWMVILFSLPVFLSYGMVYQAGPGFYVIALISMVLLCLIAVSGASIVVMLGAIALPAGKIRTLFVILGVLLAILLVLVLRMMRPEQLVNPDAFASVVMYMNSMQTLQAPALPTTWITEAIEASLHGRWKAALFNLALLASCFAFVLFWSDRLASLLYFRGFSRAQTTAQRLFAPLRFRGRGWERLLFFMSRPARALAVKDIRTFFRDATQWPQLFLIMALIAVYLYNFSVMPFDKAPVRTVYLQNVFSFLNMGLATFVLSAISARFVFPAVSMEGEAFWILRSSPLSMKTFLWIKFFFFGIPLLILTLGLVWVSNILLQVTPFMMALSMINVFCMVLGIVGLAVGLGAIHRDLKSENPALVATSFGGLVFMLCCFGLVASVITLQAGPVYRLFMADLHGLPLSFQMLTWSVASFSVSLILCLAAVFIPMRRAVKHLASHL